MWAEVKHTRNICNLISHLGNSGPRAYQNETGLHREECLMLSDRIQTQFPALTWRLKTTPNSSSRNPMLSSDLQGTRHACIHMVCRHRCRQSTSGHQRNLNSFKEIMTMEKKKLKKQANKQNHKNPVLPSLADGKNMTSPQQK